ncbi:MAG: hypothetical protein NTV86_20870 [Planctomycetota bacterium]|nr:hypothetical protein [Planctomycetota bacterium]
MRRRSLATVVIGLFLAAPAAGESGITITPAPEAPQSMLPYRTARLTIPDASTSVTPTLSVQDVRGGVTVLVQPIDRTDNGTTILLPLPATSTQQSYRVRHLPVDRPDAPALLEPAAIVAWPGDVVENSLATLVDPQAYDRLAHLAPVWPASARRSVFLLAALACLLLIATMFVPARSVRLWVMLALTVAITIGAGLALNGQDLLLIHDEPGLTVVSARRTTDWIARGRLVPIYAVKSQLTADTTVLGPGDVLQTTIRPDAMRIFVRPPVP